MTICTSHGMARRDRVRVHGSSVDAMASAACGDQAADEAAARANCGGTMASAPGGCSRRPENESLD